MAYIWYVLGGWAAGYLMATVIERLGCKKFLATAVEVGYKAGIDSANRQWTKAVDDLYQKQQAELKLKGEQE